MCSLCLNKSCGKSSFWISYKPVFYIQNLVLEFCEEKGQLTCNAISKCPTGNYWMLRNKNSRSERTSWVKRFCAMLSYHHKRYIEYFCVLTAKLQQIKVICLAIITPCCSHSNSVSHLCEHGTTGGTKTSGRKFKRPYCKTVCKVNLHK